MKQVYACNLLHLIEIYVCEMNSLQVMKLIKMGSSNGKQCLILDSTIFEKIRTDAAVINSIIKKEFLGSTQARRKGEKRSRCTLIFINAFNNEEQDRIFEGTNYFK